MVKQFKCIVGEINKKLFTKLFCIVSIIIDVPLPGLDRSLLAADIVESVIASYSILICVPVIGQHDVYVHSPTVELQGVGAFREVGALGQRVEGIRVAVYILDEVVYCMDDCWHPCVLSCMWKI